MAFRQAQFLRVKSLLGACAPGNWTDWEEARVSSNSTLFLSTRDEIANDVSAAPSKYGPLSLRVAPRTNIDQT